MGRLFLIDLEGDFYSCKHCQTPFALADDLISKYFHRNYGLAYLFDKAVNVLDGEEEDVMIFPGRLSTIADIICVKCGSILGWKFEGESEVLVYPFKILGPDEDLDMPALEDA